MEVNWKVFLVISVVTGLGGILTVTLLYTLTGGDVPFDYGVVIDAGSSHTQITTYKWEGDKVMGTGIAWQAATCKVQGGISESIDPTAGANSLQPCLENNTQVIPAEKRSSTPLVLGATAGMRLLNITLSDRTTAIMIALKCLLDKSGLSVKHVQILSGEVEGLSAWITANFLKGNIQNTVLERNTIGAFDLGGASTQYAVEVSDEIGNVSTTVLKLYGFNHRVLSRSYLCFGSNEAYRRYTASLVEDLNGTEIISSPCLPEGFQINHTAAFLFDQPCTRTNRTALWLFLHPEMKSKNFTFEGRSDASNCSADVSDLLETKKCSERNYTLCFEHPPTSIVSKSFMAFSGYFYTADFINSTKSTLKEFENATEELCRKNITEVEVLPTQHPELRTVFCFQANLVHRLLQQGYGFNDTTWNNVQFVKKVNQTDVGWSLGYMINATNAIPAEVPNPPTISLAVFILLLVLSLAILLMSVFFFRKTRQVAGTVYETI